MLPPPCLAPTALWTVAALFVFGALNATYDVAMNAQGAELEVRMDRPIMSSLHGGFSLGGLMGRVVQQRGRKPVCARPHTC